MKDILKSYLSKQLKTRGKSKSPFHCAVGQRLQLIFKAGKPFDSHFTVWDERRGCTQGPYLGWAPESRGQKLGPTFPVLSSSCPTWTLNHGNCKPKPIMKREKKKKALLGKRSAKYCAYDLISDSWAIYLLTQTTADETANLLTHRYVFKWADFVWNSARTLAYYRFS